MKFREHRGGLADSMQTEVELVDHDALLAHIRHLLRHYPTAPEVTPETVDIQPYSYDERIGWTTYIVTLKKYGVVGFTDSPAVAKSS